MTNNDAQRGKRIAESGIYEPKAFAQWDTQLASNGWQPNSPPSLYLVEDIGEDELLPDVNDPRPTDSGEGPIPGAAGTYVDVAKLLNGELPQPRAPILLTRTDGCALLYAGRVNTLFGDPEAGKTWVALAACVEALRDGRRVLYMDLDHNGVESVVGNLLALGASRYALVDPATFRYCAPQEPGEIYNVVADCEIWRPAVTVIDSVGELLPQLGSASHSDDDYTVANSRVLQPLADAGAAVVTIDHLAKNLNSRLAGPVGAGAKRRALGGTSLRVKVSRQFIPGKGGAAWLLVNKDRHGGVRKNCPSGEREPMAGTFVLDPPRADGVVMSWRVTTPQPAGRPGESLNTKEGQYLEVVRGLAPDWVTIADVATVMFPVAEGKPNALTRNQREQIRYYLSRLADRDLLEFQAGSNRSPARWRVPEISSGFSSESPFFDPVQDFVQEGSEP